MPRPDRLVGWCGWLLRLAMPFCGRCDMDDQFNLGIELMIRGLDCKNGEPGC